jgi:phosphoribosyl 1,2-cyclic phosphodiesterase
VTEPDSVSPTVVRFWGTRGTIPVAATARQIRSKIATALMQSNGMSFASATEAELFIDDRLEFATSGTYGGATSCVEIDCTEDAFFVCDMGSGLREFGIDAMARCRNGRKRVYNIFLSHLHWDHIMGFPVFLPCFDPNSRVVIHACHPDAEEALRRQQEEISFPVPFDSWRAKVRFVTMEPGKEIEVGGLRVTAMSQHHPHGSYAYRFRDSANRTVVYSTDSEHKADRMDREIAFIGFFQRANLVICDTMYSLADSNSMKEDWGHSSNVVAIDLCHQARAKRLVLFHHEPTSDDNDIQRMHEESIRYETLTRDGSALEVLCAYDGLEITL